MKKLLRLFVMATIRNPEEYYKKSLITSGVNPEELTHEQIAAWKALVKQIEADILIDTAFRKEKTDRKKIDGIHDSLLKLVNKSISE